MHGYIEQTAGHDRMGMNVCSGRSVQIQEPAWGGERLAGGWVCESIGLA